MITLFMIILVSLTWFASALPFAISYHIVLFSKSKKLKLKLPFGHILIVYIFMFFLTAILGFTGIPSIRDIVHNSFGIITSHGLNIPSNEVNLVPFYWASKGIIPYIENIFLFVPFGFLLPCVQKKYKTLWRTVLSGFSFSLIIELSQLFNRRVTDIDDLLMNTLGAFIGWCIFRLLTQHLIKLKGQVSDNAGTPMYVREEACFYMISAFAGMFFLYYPLF